MCIYKQWWLCIAVCNHLVCDASIAAGEVQADVCDQDYGSGIEDEEGSTSGNGTLYIRNNF